MPALVVLVAASSYTGATFLGGVVLRAPGTRRTVSNLARLTIMAFDGVSVPRDFFPVVVERLAAVLPLTHGLDAIRALFAGAGPAAILGDAALEALVGALWLALSLLAFRALADAGRRDGSIVFSG